MSNDVYGPAVRYYQANNGARDRPTCVNCIHDLGGNQCAMADSRWSERQAAMIHINGLDCAMFVHKDDITDNGYEEGSRYTKEQWFRYGPGSERR